MEITAYHEAGHTLVAYFTQDHAPVRKVSIVLEWLNYYILIAVPLKNYRNFGSITNLGSNNYPYNSHHHILTTTLRNGYDYMVM